MIDNQRPFIVNVNHKGHTILTGNHHYIVAPTLISYHGEKTQNEVRGQRVDRPIDVIDTSNRYGLVTAFMMHYYGASVGAPVTEPLGTITAQGEHIAAVQAFLIKYYGTDIGQNLTDPLHTITSKDRFGLVMVQGLPYWIVDIGMRMLTPRELFDAQGFPHDYIIDRDAEGNPYPKFLQVARCGNAVPPQYSSWEDWTLFDGERRWIVDPETVGQYTGQKDVNGVDIYEGDILEDVNENTLSRNKLRMVVSFGQYHPVCNSGIELGFFMKHIPERDMWRRDFMFLVNDGVKVIGNVFDNPELLKDGEDGEN